MGKKKAEQNKEGIVAIYQYLDDFEKAVKQIYKRDDFNNCELLSHTSYHELMHLAEEKYGYSGLLLLEANGLESTHCQLMSFLDLNLWFYLEQSLQF